MFVGMFLLIETSENGADLFLGQPDYLGWRSMIRKPFNVRSIIERIICIGCDYMRGNRAISQVSCIYCRRLGECTSFMGSDVYFIPEPT